MISLFERGYFEIMMDEERCGIRLRPEATAAFKPIFEAVKSGRVICANEGEQREYEELKGRFQEGEGWHELRYGEPYTE